MIKSRTVCDIMLMECLREWRRKWSERLKRWIIAFREFCFPFVSCSLTSRYILSSFSRLSFIILFAFIFSGESSTKMRVERKCIKYLRARKTFWLKIRAHVKVGLVRENVALTWIRDDTFLRNYFLIYLVFFLNLVNCSFSTLKLKKETSGALQSRTSHPSRDKLYLPFLFAPKRKHIKLLFLFPVRDTKFIINLN